MARDFAYCLSPFHLLQTLCLAKPDRQMTILSLHPDRYAGLLDFLPRVQFHPAVDWRPLADQFRQSEPFDYYYAVPWNRPALRLEKLALAHGGHVGILEDGLANYRPDDRPRDLRYYLLRTAYRLVDGTQYCDSIVRKRADPHRTTFYTIDARRSILGERATQIDFAAMPAIVDGLAPRFAHLDRYRGTPVFLDINDCEGGWYPFEKKIEILRSILPKEPMLYFPHPGQKLFLTEHFPNLIDMSGKTSNWNEMAIYFLAPDRIYSILSTSVLTLRDILKLKFENIQYFGTFWEQTRHPAFKLHPNLEQVLLTADGSRSRQ